MQWAAQLFPLALAFAAPQLESVRYPVRATSLVPPEGSETAACVAVFLVLSQANAADRATSVITAKTVAIFFMRNTSLLIRVAPRGVPRALFRADRQWVRCSRGHYLRALPPTSQTPVPRTSPRAGSRGTRLRPARPASKALRRDPAGPAPSAPKPGR